MMAESPFITTRHKKAISSPGAWSQRVSAFCAFCDPASDSPGTAPSQTTRASDPKVEEVVEVELSSILSAPDSYKLKLQTQTAPAEQSKGKLYQFYQFYLPPKAGSQRSLPPCLVLGFRGASRLRVE